MANNTPVPGGAEQRMLECECDHSPPVIVKGNRVQHSPFDDVLLMHRFSTVNLSTVALNSQCASSYFLVFPLFTTKWYVLDITIQDTLFE